MLTMLKKDFWYDLPKELIAQEPASPRDSARLMVLSQKDDSIQHKIFRDLPDFLEPGDLLVVNNSKVLPARIVGIKQPTGAWSAASHPPVSNPEIGTWSAKRLKTFYPIPTHSRHNLIALLSTVAASPRQTPKHSMAAPAISSATCAAAFFPQLIFHHPFRFCVPIIAWES